MATANTNPAAIAQTLRAEHVTGRKGITKIHVFDAHGTLVASGVQYRTAEAENTGRGCWGELNVAQSAERCALYGAASKLVAQMRIANKSTVH